MLMNCGETMLDNRQIESHWTQIKPQVLSHWTKLSESEVEKTHGNVKPLEKLVHSKYGKRVNFEKEYEEICNRFADKKKEKLLRKESLIENQDEMDDEDQDGMTYFDDHSADYTGLVVSQQDQEELLKPNMKGMEETIAQVGPLKEVELPIKPETEETGIHENTETKTAPDEIKPNHDPLSSNSEDITLGRSNSSANTTSPSALTSSEATKTL